MNDDSEITRRGFIELSSAAFLATTSGGAQVADQIDSTELGLDSEVDTPALLLGPDTARPEPGDGYFEQFATGPELLYMAFNGNQYRYDPSIPDWVDITVIPTNQLNEVETQNSISFFNHTFARPESPDTKNWEFTDADITKFESEVELAATTVLETTQRGNYPPGSDATPGVAIRVTDTPTGGDAIGGYFDTNNGGGVGEDATDSFVFMRKGGVEKKVYRSDWNGHVPDSRVWVTNRPVIARLPHLFYGGGDFKIRALLHEDDGSELRTLHTFTPTNVDDVFSDGPPFDQPNLPARFETNSLTGGSLRANACHYQYSLSETENRVNGEHFGPTTVGTTGWTELLTWQKRSSWEMVNVKPLKISVAATTNPVRLQLQLGPSVSSSTTSLPTDTSSSETSVEIVDGEISSDGERRWVGYVPAGQGQQSDALSAEGLTFNLPADRPVALFGQAHGGDATANGAVAWEEYF